MFETFYLDDNQKTGLTNIMQTLTWIKLTIGLAALANVLQLAGFVAPMWIWIDQGGFTVGVGLWSATGCGISGTCDTPTPSVSFNYSRDDTFDTPGFKAVQSLQTLGLAGGVLLLLLLILFRLGYDSWRHLDQLHLATFITAIFTWLCILTGVLVYCGCYWPVVGTSPLISSNSFPWSLMLCLLAGITFLIVCLLVRLQCRASQYVKSAMPVSGDSQMDLHPVTKHGLLHRYFAPAYHAGRRPNYFIGVDNAGFAANDVTNRPTVTSGVRRNTVLGVEKRTSEGFTMDGLNENTQSAGQRRMTTIGSSMFEGNGNNMDNGFNYRYLPTTQDTVTRTQTVLRQPTPNPTPTTIVTYHDLNANNGYNHFRHVDQVDSAPVRNYAPELLTNRNGLGPGHHVTQSSAYQSEFFPTRTETVYRSGVVDVTGFHDNGVSKGFHNNGVTGFHSNAMTGFHNNGVTERDVSYNQSRRDISPGPFVTRVEVPDRQVVRRTTLAGPIVTSSGSYVAGVTDPPPGLLLNNNALDSRFTSDGRMTADADVLNSEFRRTDRSLSVGGSNHSGRSASALQYTTHLGPYGASTKSVAPMSNSVSLLDPTFIYRPRTEELY